MVAFTIYTVVMRYVFHDPPFWGDTISLFCNIWLVLLAYALAVRDREDIASEGIYEFLTPKTVLVLRFAWRAMTFIFGVLLFWFGLDAALNVPGQYWELGGLPKRAPMMVLPICGVLIALVTAFTLARMCLVGALSRSFNLERFRTARLLCIANACRPKSGRKRFFAAIGGDLQTACRQWIGDQHREKPEWQEHRWSLVNAAVLAVAVGVRTCRSLAQPKPVRSAFSPVIRPQPTKSRC